MSFPRYERYKDSGVEWLGEVPEGWKVKALKRGYSVRLGKMLQPGSSSPEDELLPYLRASNIQWSGVDLSDLKLMWFSSAEKQQLTLQYGDLLVSEGGDVGRSALWRDEMRGCYFQNAINRVRAQDGNSTSYLCYWMSVIKDKGYIDVLCNKSTIAHFTAEKVQSVPVPFPPLPEQQAIAAFLDRETGKIDVLVAEQERLIALLAEKRQATISHAVTKGLNPEAPLKDSGIEWLGEVPEGWEVGALKYFVAQSSNSIKTGPFGSQLTSAEMQSGEIKVYNQRNVIDGDLSSGDNYITAQKFNELSAFEVFPGDLLITTRGTIGRTAILPDNAEKGVLHPCLIRVQVDSKKLTNNYLQTLLQDSHLLQTQISILSNATTIEVIYSDTLASLILPIPPFDEQSAIVAFLDSETAKIDTLVGEARQVISLLKERRSALISAAVTGKIDVRHLEAA